MLMTLFTFISKTIISLVGIKNEFFHYKSWSHTFDILFNSHNGEPLIFTLLKKISWIIFYCIMHIFARHVFYLGLLWMWVSAHATSFLECICNNIVNDVSRGHKIGHLACYFIFRNYGFIDQLSQWYVTML
jgi:hypothetical protein